MKILEQRHFAGINIHCYKPVLETVVDLEDLAAKETCDFPGFSEELVKVLPGLREHVCGLGRRGGFVLRLEQGTYFGHVLEHVAIELLALAGYKSSYGKTRAIDEKRGHYRIVVQCHWPRVAMEAVKMAKGMIEDIVTKKQCAPPDIKRLEKILTQEKPGPSTQAIIEAAVTRRIPVKIIGHGSLLRLGTGRYRKYVEATVTGQTSCIGVDIASDKTLTKRILSEAMIPVPRGRIARDEEDAVAIARELGATVVVKPCDGNQGKGVSLNLNSETEIRSAYKLAENYSDKIMVEEQIFGRHYRILVVDQRVEAVAERFPAMVKGDGLHTIKELIEIENLNPLRGEEHEKPLTKIKVDQVMFNVLARQNLTMNYVPSPGEAIVLRDNANLSTGGTAVDVTELIHPDNVHLACRIARLVGLDVAGIDLVAEDIGKPVLGSTGAVIEINAAPGIRMHLFPSRGKRRPVGDAIVDYLFPWHKPFAIPLVSITGTNGKTTTARLIAHALQQSGKQVGLATTDGIYIDGKCVDSGDNTGPASADMVLSDPLVDVAVLETARGGLIKRGLGYQQADVAVVTNISADHLGSDGINSLEELCHVKALVVETVAPEGNGVLNADDPWVVKMAERCPGRITYFSLRGKDNRVFVRHIAAGGRGVMLFGQKIVLVEGYKVKPVINVKDVPVTYSGCAQYNIANCLAATGALWGLGMDAEQIAAGLRSFDPIKHNPGRANYYRLAGYDVLLDYGHNPAGYSNVLQWVASLSYQRKVGVIGVPGDRRDEDILAVGRLCGQNLDVIYIKEDMELRGRKSGEVASLLEKGVKQASAKAEVKVVLDELKAVGMALDRARPGDLVVVFYEKLEPVKALIGQWQQREEKEEFAPTR